MGGTMLEHLIAVIRKIARFKRPMNISIDYDGSGEKGFKWQLKIGGNITSEEFDPIVKR